MTTLNSPIVRTGRLQRLTNAINRVIANIKELFSLEEVEVTFTQVGDSTRYSYTKVEHKHA